MFFCLYLLLILILFLSMNIKLPSTDNLLLIIYYCYSESFLSFDFQYFSEINNDDNLSEVN